MHWILLALIKHKLHRRAHRAVMETLTRHEKDKESEMPLGTSMF